MLDVAGLSAGYGGIGVLDGIDLSVPAGACVAVVGRNGMGKTTLLKALMGFVPARARRLRLDRRDIRALPTHLRARAGMAWVPQGREIFPALTVRENLMLGALGGPGGDGTAAERVDAAVARFPVLGALLERRGGTLSGGEQQAAALARALCAAPRLLLLDEPTEGIQPSLVEALAETLRTLVSEGLAVLLVEQNLDFAAAVASRTAVMERGRLSGHHTGEPVN